LKITFQHGKTPVYYGLLAFYQHISNDHVISHHLKILKKSVVFFKLRQNPEMMQQLMNSPMVQQMMSNPETGSEGSESPDFFIVLTDGLRVTILMLKKKTFFPSPQKKTCQKVRSFISNENT